MLPTFVGIGVPRAGTTWLHEILDAHPEVAVPTLARSRPHPDATVTSRDQEVGAPVSRASPSLLPRRSKS